ncbi:MAG: outer membrane beta-barrel protein, partial [Ferruginibacter sp.]
FEQLIKEKADQFRMYPSKRVWHSIYNNLHPSRRWPSVIMSLLLLTSLSLIGYLNTGDNTINRQINNTPLTKNEIDNTQKAESKKKVSTYTSTQQQPVNAYDHAFDDVITNETDFYTYTIVKSNRPPNFYTPAPVADVVVTAAKDNAETNGKDLIQDVDTYIKSNKIFTDIAVSNKKNKTNSTRSTTKNNNTDLLKDDNTEDDLNTTITNKNTVKPATVNTDKADINELAEGDKKAIVKISGVEEKNALTNEEKSWIENYTLLSKPAKNKWKDNLAFQFYATPAVNYRKLSSKTKGSTTPFATMGDINNAISQKPGFGFETGLGVTYSIAKRLRLKAGFQFNYTNYNIAADQTNHPVVTTILLVDPNTGYSYSASRISTTANAYNNSTPLQPVTLHNRTYQISMPVGFAYKLSTEKNVDWFAGASVQPTYVFGGNAHIISSDLKSYVSDPSSIRTWNLNLGFETYMNFKLGTYQLQVGPQVRYQVYSTYRKTVALIEKPYAVGLKFGLTKGF